MIAFIDSILSQFKADFSRIRSFRWFTVIICGMLTRSDHLGVTSFIRALGLPGSKYECLLHFFRSKAFDLEDLVKKWYGIVSVRNILYKINDRFVLCGDATKFPKEGFRMPGVLKIFQESEDAGKAAYTFGSMFGAVSVLVSNAERILSLPLKINMQEGLKDLVSWEGSTVSELSHVVQMIRNGYAAAEHFGKCYFLLDRYFLSVPALTVLDELNAGKHLVDIITRAKMSCRAFELLPPGKTGGKKKAGRPKRRGNPVKVADLFTTKRDLFRKATVNLYGKDQELEYYCTNLLWGQKLYKELRFVLVISGDRKGIYVSTDRDLDPLSIIGGYGVRFKIESMFRSFKLDLAGFGYHFWTLATPKLKRFAKSKENRYEGVVDESCRRRILECIRATEGFVFCACVAQGILQMIALDPTLSQEFKGSRYLRTESKESVSEGSVRAYLTHNFYRLLLLSPENELTQNIQKAILAKNKSDSQQEAV